MIGVLFNFCESIISKVNRRLYQKRSVAALRKAGAIIDESTIVFLGMPQINIGKGAKVSIGSHFFCTSGPKYAIDQYCCSKITVRPNSTLKIGNYSGIANTTIYVSDEVTIGNSVNIGAGCLIFDTDFHSTDWRDRLERRSDIVSAKKKPVHIGDCVFIGARSIIGKGVTIGARSIVAAGSVVTRDIPERELWGGYQLCLSRK